MNDKREKWWLQNSQGSILIEAIGTGMVDCVWLYRDGHVNFDSYGFYTRNHLALNRNGDTFGHDLRGKTR